MAGVLLAAAGQQGGCDDSFRARVFEAMGGETDVTRLKRMRIKAHELARDREGLLERCDEGELREGGLLWTQILDFNREVRTLNAEIQKTRAEIDELEEIEMPKPGEGILFPVLRNQQEDLFDRKLNRIQGH